MRTLKFSFLFIMINLGCSSKEKEKDFKSSLSGSKSCYLVWEEKRYHLSPKQQDEFLSLLKLSNCQKKIHELSVELLKHRIFFIKDEIYECMFLDNTILYLYNQKLQFTVHPDAFDYCADLVKDKEKFIPRRKFDGF